MSSPPPFGFAIMSDGSVQSGDCTGMTLTAERAQAAIGFPSLPEDKEEMKLAIARLLFDLMHGDSDQQGDPGAGSSGEQVLVKPTSENSTLGKEDATMETTVVPEDDNKPAAAINRKSEKKSGRKGKKNRGRR